MIWEFITTWLGRALAAWIAGLASWLLVHYGIAISADQQKALVEHLVGVVIPTLLTLYSITHKVLDKHLNPGDAASTHIAEKEKVEHDRLAH